MQKLDALSGHLPNKWTWQGLSLLFFAQQGFDVINIENLNYKKFARLGKSYLRTIWNTETYTIQRKYSDLTREQSIARALIRQKNIKLVFHKNITLAQATSLMRKGYVVLVSVNPYTLRGEQGYASHTVVLTGSTRSHIIYHDPGPPGYKHKKISKYIFEKAMTKPAKDDGNIIAIK